MMRLGLLLSNVGVNKKCEVVVQGGHRCERMVQQIGVSLYSVYCIYHCGHLLHPEGLALCTIEPDRARDVAPTFKHLHLPALVEEDTSWTHPSETGKRTIHTYNLAMPLLGKRGVEKHVHGRNVHPRREVDCRLQQGYI